MPYLQILCSSSVTGSTASRATSIERILMKYVKESNAKNEAFQERIITSLTSLTNAVNTLMQRLTSSSVSSFGIYTHLYPFILDV